MARPLLRLAFPLMLVLAVPALQVIIDRLALSRTAGPAAVCTHTVMLAAATFVFIFFNGANLFATAAVARLRRTNHALAEAFARDAYLVSISYAILTFLLSLLPNHLLALLLGRDPSPDEEGLAQYLLWVVGLLLIQHATLVSSLARCSVRPLLLASTAGLLVHIALLALSLPTLTLIQAGAARYWGAVTSCGLSIYLSGDRGPRPPVSLPSRRTLREVAVQGTVVGLHSLAGFLFVGFLFFVALRETGEESLAAGARAFGWYTFLGALPLAVAQATGILASNSRDPVEGRLIIRTGVRLAAACSALVASLLVGTGVSAWASEGSTDFVIAALGIAAFSALDGPGQAVACGLRGMGRQRSVLAATLVVGSAYTLAVFFVPGDTGRWVALGFYGGGLFLLLRKILHHEIPNATSRGGRSL